MSLSARQSRHSRHAHAGPSQRQLRVGEMLRHALADVLRRDEICAIPISTACR